MKQPVSSLFPGVKELNDNKELQRNKIKFKWVTVQQLQEKEIKVKPKNNWTITPMDTNIAASGSPRTAVAPERSDHSEVSGVLASVLDVGA